MGNNVVKQPAHGLVLALDLLRLKFGSHSSLHDSQSVGRADNLLILIDREFYTRHIVCLRRFHWLGLRPDEARSRGPILTNFPVVRPRQPMRADSCFF